MSFPKVPSNYRQERAGVNSVAGAIASLGHIWRETSTADVGIDGHIEFVSSEGNSTGRLIAAQVKSGASYFHDHDTHWHFYPDQKHRLYWERFPLPVILFLHDPKDGTIYWCDARHWLRSPQNSNHAYIAIPKNQRLDKTTGSHLFAATGVGAEAFLDIPEVFSHMINTKCANPAFPVTYFEVFVHGLTNICRTLYFSMDVAMNVAEFNLGRNGITTGLGCGSAEQNFLFSYTQFIVSQHIADIDFSDCLIDWFDRQLQPTYFAPLTSRGRSLITLISEYEDRLRASGTLQTAFDEIRIVQDAFIGIHWTQSTGVRLALAADFAEKSFAGMAP